jgi:ATP-dependent Clp protease ATP-binding subunit ClpA
VPEHVRPPPKRVQEVCQASAQPFDNQLAHSHMWPQEVRGTQKVTSQNPEGTQEALSKYARDLTAAAAEGKLDPVSQI